jgi:hypothetical protein
MAVGYGGVDSPNSARRNPFSYPGVDATPTLTHRIQTIRRGGGVADSFEPSVGHRGWAIARGIGYLAYTKFNSVL